MCDGSGKSRHAHEVDARDHLRRADHPGGAVPGAAGRGGRELAALEPGDRGHLTDCMAEHCWGIEPYMLNSLTLAIPATIISTLLGALAGYSISLWRFRGDQFVFGLVTLGIFLPEQMKLIPWVVVLRDLSLMNTIAGLILIHTVQGMSFTTLFCRNYYVGIPQDLLKAARIDGAGFFRIFWRIILPLSPPILIVTVIFQFTGIWNEFLYGVTFTSGGQQPVTAALIALSAAITSEPMSAINA